MIHYYIFFEAQCQNPIKNDWVSSMKKVLSNIHVNLSFEEIKNMKKKDFLMKVDDNINVAAVSYLKGKIKSKGSEIKYAKYLSSQRYLMPNKTLTLTEQRSIFEY